MKKLDSSFNYFFTFVDSKSKFNILKLSYNYVLLFTSIRIVFLIITKKISLEKVQKYLKKPAISYLLFWVLFFVFTATTSSWYYSGLKEIVITFSIRIFFQCIVASIIVFILIPRFLIKRKTGLFFICTALLLLVLYVSCTIIKMYYLEVQFPETYQNYLSKLKDHSFYGRLFRVKEFLRVANYILQPTFILLAIRFYRKQQALAKLNEQKKIAELAVLKNQLNPHFLFNTLNNLYALAYKKSEKTMLVIQKLSEILDYTLYGCNDVFVPISKEIELIDNYLTLEKIRYDDRVIIAFDNKINNSDIKIAPLLLLTFIENAFKHGVSQELTQAKISIVLEQKEKYLNFHIQNTQPSSIANQKKEAIGIKNVKQQLDLLYNSNYELLIDNNVKTFSVHLKILLDEV